MVSVNPFQADGIAQTFTRVDLTPQPIVLRNPSWTGAMNESAPSLKTTFTDASFSLPPDVLAGPWTATSVSKHFSSSFAPMPNHWITFGSFENRQEINVPAGNFNVAPGPHLKA
ncbi:hypothetical protein ACFWP0_13385 [Achromobacter sp. NPDC058515]|uniref:hypothetical protein n=1 Tax=Achromobacter sp. NPDC058515 TaxID=3346533 RepID=UPI00364E3796